MAARDLMVCNADELALTTSWTTILMAKAATNQRFRVKRWGVFFDSAALGAGVQAELIRVTTDGTMTSAAAVVIGLPGSETTQTTFYHTATAEPTAGDVIDVAEGAIDVIFPMGQEPIVPGAGRIAIRCKADAAVNVRGKLIIEE